MKCLEITKGARIVCNHFSCGYRAEFCRCYLEKNVHELCPYYQEAKEKLNHLEHLTEETFKKARLEL
jgi:hypothetical protein